MAITTRKRKASFKSSKSTKRTRTTPRRTKSTKTTKKSIKPSITTLGVPKDSRRTETVLNPHVVAGESRISTRTLYGGNATTISRISTADVSIDRRIVDKIKAHGVALYMQMQNLVTSQCFFNVAVVTTRRTSTIANLANGLATYSNFFASPGAERGQDFKSGTGGLAPLEFFTYPVNPDEFQVHHHSRHMLGAAGAASDPCRGSAGCPVFKKVEVYVPLNIDVAYQGATATTGVNNTYILYWCDLVSAGPTSVPTTLAVRCQARAVTYWSQKA